MLLLVTGRPTVNKIAIASSCVLNDASLREKKNVSTNDWTERLKQKAAWRMKNKMLQLILRQIVKWDAETIRSVRNDNSLRLCTIRFGHIASNDDRVRPSDERQSGTSAVNPNAHLTGWRPSECADPWQL